MKQKWRPHLSTIIAAMLLITLMMPLAGLFFFRLYENQLIRETEGELIAQAAVLAAVYGRAVEQAAIPPGELGAIAPAPANPNEPYHPVPPELDLALNSIEPRRPDPLVAAKPVSPAFAAIGAWLDPLLTQVQATTLAGFRVLDANGAVIAGRDEKGLSLAHVGEVQKALSGQVASVLRQRVSDEPPPPLYSISRGTHVRVFVAYPVVASGHVAGVIYLSRTPSNIVKHLYEERGKLALALMAVLAGASLLGFIVIRTLSGPIRELTRRTRRIATGDRDAMQPLRRHGTREVAELSQGLLSMARQLSDRSDQVSAFATHVSHELKSPLTAIQGAAELIRDAGSEMTEAERATFLGNIIADTGRLNLLVRRLLDLARARGMTPDGASATLDEATALLDDGQRAILAASGETGLRLAMSAANLAAVIGNLVANSQAHGASRVALELRRAGADAVVMASDDGSGISPNNAARIFDPFFTTRRDAGGTGMGLGIVKSMLEAHGGTIALEPAERGATFRLVVPLARH